MAVTKSSIISDTNTTNYPITAIQRRHDRKLISVAESYAPTTASDWTSLDGVSTAPSTQDGALDILATSCKNLEANDPDSIITAQGDIITGDASGDGQALAVGAAGTVLVSDGTDPSWSADPTVDSVHINDATTAAYDLVLVADGDGGTPLSADHSITIDVFDADRVIDLAGDISIAGGLTQAGAFATTITSTEATSVTLPPSAKLKGFAKATVLYTDLNTATSGVAFNAGETLPIGAVVTRAYFNVTAAFTGDGDHASTVSVGIQDQAVDIQAAAAVSGAPFDATGWEEGSVGIDGTVANFIEISSSAKQIAVTWTAGGTDTALATGSVDVYVEYVY